MPLGRDMAPREGYAFEVPSSSEWAFQQFSPGLRANTFVDISSTIDKKVRAMSVYDSESRPFPHPRSGQGLEALAKQRGTIVGLNAAEAFELIRQII